MCGRFTQHYIGNRYTPFSVCSARNLQPHYNIAPRDTVDVIRLDPSDKRELVPMRWDLIPGWWKKSAKEVPATFNARAESVTDRPMFRNAFRGSGAASSRQAVLRMDRSQEPAPAPFFPLADGSPAMGFTGLLQRWRDVASNKDTLSCTIIVCDANEWMERYRDRKPVILQKDFGRWLDVSLGAEVLTCAAEDALRSWPVSPRLDRTGVADDDPTITEAEPPGKVRPHFGHRGRPTALRTRSP